MSDKPRSPELQAALDSLATSPSWVTNMAAHEAANGDADITAGVADVTPPCRVCGKSEPVLCYDPKNQSTAICPACCEKGAEHDNGETGHEWQYDRYERSDACAHCGIFKHDTNYDYSEDYEP